MSDEPQIESTAVMLRHAGYEVKVCGQELRNELVNVGFDTVISVQHMEQLGYDKLDSSVGEATVKDMDRCDLFVEIKVRNLAPLWNRWPRLHNKTVWWRVNGAQPEICDKGGDEVNLLCPLITACFWYGIERYRKPKEYAQGQAAQEHEISRPVSSDYFEQLMKEIHVGDNGMAYTFWPPFPKSEKFDAVDRSKYGYKTWKTPYSLCHSARAWGYGSIIDWAVEQGIQIFGNNSPAGQTPHKNVYILATYAKCLVHLKSVDCPGWALYEALLSGCPVVTGRLLNSRMLAYQLLQHEETCYEFGVPASLEYGRGDMDFGKCMEDIKYALERLSDPAENLRIGENGRKRLNSLMWRSDRDGDEFLKFMARHGHGL
jgi:hypothetical protein